ncbi:MAG: hypothetical protein LC792_25125 [Actinobacteria bacterium]|nr:hypothetical protein [Actinomycetota bacterium]
MERDDPIVVDLDEAEAEIRQRWFVWTAAGLTVDPVTWTDQTDAAAPRPRVARAEVTTAARLLGLHVSRPSAHADIILRSDGWTELAVLRPGAVTVVHTAAHVESVEAFGHLLDRVVELITWSGVPKENVAADRRVPRPERAAHWVLGYDGERWSGQA